LKIHPNTAHKIIQFLIREQWLEVHPGIGTVVARIPEVRPGDRKRLLHGEVEQLVVEAKRVGVQLKDVVDAVAEQWAILDRSKDIGQRK
jgi:GntR family transcriptional regulator